VVSDVVGDKGEDSVEVAAGLWWEVGVEVFQQRALEGERCRPVF
jgi:hypothetical protein